MPGFKETCHVMPQLGTKQGGPKKLPNLPFDNDISHAGGGSQALTPNVKSMQPHTVKAPTGSKRTGA